MSDENSMLGMPGLPANVDPHYLTPEMAQQLAKVAYSPEESSALQQQLAQAIALRNGPEVRQQSAKAALFDGIGNIARNIESRGSEDRIRGQQHDLLSNNETAYARYLRLFGPQMGHAQALRGGAPGATAQDPYATGLPQMDLSQT